MSDTTVPARELTLDIESPAAGGTSIARHDGQVVFVSGGLPGARLIAPGLRRGAQPRALLVCLPPAPLSLAPPAVAGSPARARSICPRASPFPPQGRGVRRCPLPAPPEYVLYIQFISRNSNFP